MTDIRVKARDLQVGDRLFLPRGEKVTLTSVKVGRYVHVVSSWGETRLDPNRWYDVERESSRLG